MPAFHRYPSNGVKLNDLKGAVLTFPAFPDMRWFIPPNVTATTWQIINLHNGSVSEGPHYNTLIDWIDKGTVNLAYYPLRYAATSFEEVR